MADIINGSICGRCQDGHHKGCSGKMKQQFGLKLECLCRNYVHKFQRKKGPGNVKAKQLQNRDFSSAKRHIG
jgi:hypothetical protein